jgi:uncharacterized protein YndB with AHSA1/START domain
MTSDEPVVERMIELEQPVDEVWAALTEPARLSAWVGGKVTELALRPGGRGTVRRPDGAVRRLLVEVLDPARRLALRWWPFEKVVGVPPGSGTRVEFLLEANGHGTRLRVVERPPLAGRVDHRFTDAIGGPVPSAASSPELQAAAR